ncbi:hypothetical protein AAHC03_09178 [Spirometra sp. Aus1]
MWFKDGKQFAENCLDFRTLQEKFECSKNETFVELTFNSVEYQLRGKWACSHADQSASIEVNISAPLIVKSPRIELLPADNRLPVAAASAFSGTGYPHTDDRFGQILRLRHPASAGSGKLSIAAETTGTSAGIGTRANPIELVQSQRFGLHSVSIECSTNCASETENLRWTIRNGTILAEYETQAVVNAGCPDGLSSTRSRATFACLLSPSGGGEVAVQQSSGHSPLRLVGLNRITCAPGSLGLSLERSLLGLRSSRADELGPLADTPDKDCTQNGHHTSACLFILCPGPPGPLLTYGEKVAIGLGTVLAILMLGLLLRLLIVQRRGKKVHIAPMRDYPDGLELML